MSEVSEEVVEETTVDETKSDTTTSQEENTEETTKESKDVAEDKKEEIEEAVLEGIELTDGDERGKFTFKIGDSVYFGNTKKEILNNVLKGKVEQDSYIKKLKIQEKVKVPEKTVDEPVLEMPNERDIYSKHITTLAKQQQIDVKMFNWTREQWNEYQDTNGLRDYEIGEIRQTVREVLKKANEMTDKDVAVANVAFINNGILEEETQSVREMLIDSGINQDEFDYNAVLEIATKKLGKNGVIQSGAITAEAGKQISKILRKSTPVKDDIKKIIEKGKEQKKEIKSIPNSNKKLNNDDDEISPSYEALSRKLKEKARSGK